ncbi:hypothetical protein RN001_003227 [Aquatica leii]|uniref:MADF domain-containing protein n=1 Tax=Aquatica leii TaxID=1421715 RepID=A0AAN7PQV1_9COLE|nr:hypothetical protein RN001_003227 [Aquatica leii]
MDGWTVEEVDKLICLIHGNSVLYDMSLPGYSNRDVKEDLWRKVVSKISNKNGSSAKQKRQWAYYQQLSFLEPHLAERETITNVNEPNLSLFEVHVVPGTYYLQPDGAMIPSPVNSESNDLPKENCSVHLLEETEELDEILVETKPTEPVKQNIKKAKSDSMNKAFSNT